MKLKNISGLLLLILIAVLAFQNIQPVNISFFNQHISLSVAFIILISLLTGILIGTALKRTPESRTASVSHSQREDNRKNIYVSNISRNTSEEDLKEKFSEYGKVASVQFIIDRHSGQPKGFGFVEMKDGKAAKLAIDNLNGNEIDGNRLNVHYARHRSGNHRNQSRNYHR